MVPPPTETDNRTTSTANFLTRLITKQVQVNARVFRCPKDDAVVLVIPADQPVPEYTEVVYCPNGDPVEVPKYRGPTVQGR